jgi:hypothetical protein
MGVIVQSPGKLVNGKLTWDSRLSFKHITDGLSKTIAMGEKHVPERLFGLWDGDASLYNGDFLLNHSRAGSDDAPLARFPDDETYCATGPSRCGNFGSQHPGICQFVLCDGSTQAFAVDMDLEILRRYTNRSDGELIEND